MPQVSSSSPTPINSASMQETAKGLGYDKANAKK